MSRIMKKRHRTSLITKTFVMVVIFGLAYITRSMLSGYPEIKKWLVMLLGIIFVIYLADVLITTIHVIRLDGATLKQIDRMSGTDFETYLARHYKKMGYSVKLTPGTMDFGGDLILQKNNEKIVIQAKRWKKTVPESAVQQVIAAKEYYGADKAAVVTNSFYTDAAVKLAKKTGVILIDRKTLGKENL